jgi:uncharacterized MAPEG superfamily protein
MLPSVDLICLPIAWLLVMMPAYSKIYFLRKNRELNAQSGEDYSSMAYNADPRAMTKRIIAAGGDVGAGLGRCEAAHANGWESLILFSIGIFAARAGAVSNDNRSIACIVYIFARFFYNLVYIGVFGTAPRMGTVRSLVWFVSTACCLYMMISGAVQGNKFPFVI